MEGLEVGARAYEGPARVRTRDGGGGAAHGTSARAQWEPAKYLEEVGGEVERNTVEERLRRSATVQGGGTPEHARGGGT